MHVPEAYGGQGFGFVELGIVLEEMGRALLCAPYFATAVLATGAILNAGTEAQKEALLPDIALAKTSPPWPSPRTTDAGMPPASTMTAHAIGAGYRLDGHKSFVLDGHTADLIIVLARHRARPAKTVCRSSPCAATPPGLTRRALKTLDPTRKFARLDLRRGRSGAARRGRRRRRAVRQDHDEAAVCLANEMVGGAERAARGRARLRQDAHAVRPADRLVPVDEAQARRHAARRRAGEVGRLLRRRRVRRRRARLPAIASLAKACGAEAYMQTAIHAIQIHGGIGFTWDNDTHLWFKRAKSSEVFLGDPTYHREQMMQHWAA